MNSVTNTKDNSTMVARKTNSEWRERLVKLTPEARAKLKSKLRASSLERWITRVIPKHAPIPPHLLRLIAVLERATREPIRVVLSMPPRHAKTVTILAALAWMVDRSPYKLNAYVTYSGNKAKSKSRLARRLAVKAGVRLDENANAALDWRTTLGGGLLATGIGGGLTGEGVDGLLVVDDPFRGRAEAESPTMREKVWEWFNDVAYTRLNPGASCIVVATRWHHDDLIGRLEEISTEDGTVWEVINFPALRAEPSLDGEVTPADEGFPLWPERFPLAELARIRRQVLEYSWASLYQGHPVPKGGAVFNNPARYKEPPEGGKLILAVDPAGTAKTKADHTAVVALLFFVGKTPEQHKAYLLECESFQLESDKAAEKLEAFQKRHGMYGLAYEATRDGHAIAKALRKINSRIKLLPIAPRGDKLVRATPVAAAWNDARVFVPYSAPWLEDFLHVIMKFTGLGDPRDDEVDALAHAWNLATGTASVVGTNSAVVGDKDRYATEGFAPKRGTGDHGSDSRNVFG
jgi:predicted phage terminase large subunit-like protein